MTSISKFLIFGAIVCIATFFCSCDEFCEESNRTAIVVNFHTSENDKPTAISVRIANVENDSVLYPNPRYFTQASNSQVLLPIDPMNDEMTFSIQNGDLPADTIIFRYTRHPGFISAECGCAVFAEIDRVYLKGMEHSIKDLLGTKHSIKGFEVIRRKVRTVSYRQTIINDENIRIYY